MVNDAYGDWSKEETNWSEKDTEIVNNVLKQNNKPVPFDYDEMLRLHETVWD